MSCEHSNDISWNDFETLYAIYNFFHHIVKFLYWTNVFILFTSDKIWGPYMFSFIVWCFAIILTSRSSLGISTNRTTHRVWLWIGNYIDLLISILLCEFDIRKIKWLFTSSIFFWGGISIINCKQTLRFIY